MISIRYLLTEVVFNGLCPNSEDGKLEKQLMHLKPEVIRVLEREKMVSEAAIARLWERCRLLEQRYGWRTNEFLTKFNAGEIGDEHEFFLWYALAEAVKDWETTRDNVEEFLAGSEAVSA